MSDTSPFDVEFQALTLAHIWRDVRIFRSFSDHIRASFWEDPAMSHLASLILAHGQEYKEPPGEAVLRELVRKTFPDASRTDHVNQRTTLTNTLERLRDTRLTDGKFVVSQLRHFLGWSSVREAIIGAIPDIQAGKFDPTIVDKLRKAVNAGINYDGLGHEAITGAPKVLWDAFDPDRSTLVPTGLTHLDQEIGGGLRAGELGVILAPPKGYKSGTLMNFACAAARRGVDRDVIYFTLELSEELQTLRFAIRTTMLPKSRLFNDPETYVKSYVARADSIYSRSVHIEYMAPYECKPSSIVRYLDAYTAATGRKPGLVIVDYLDLMGSDVQKERDYLEKVHIITDLRAVGCDYGFPIWTACRTTREAVNRRRINMAHMSGAFERVSVADLVIAHCFTDEEKIQHRSRLVFVAVRNEAGSRYINCDFRPDLMQISSTAAVELSDDDFEDDSPMRRRRRAEGEGGEDGEPPERPARRQRRRRTENTDELAGFSLTL